MDAAIVDTPIIDTDAHWTEPRDLWTSRAPAKLKDRVPRIVRDADGNDQWLVDDDIVLGPTGLCVIDKAGSKHRGIVCLPHIEDQSPAGSDPKERLKLMDEQGLYAQIVYPNALGFAGGAIMGVKDEELRNFCVTAYNDAAGDWQAAGEGRLFPQIVLPFWDLELSVKELRRCREKLGLIGFTMTDSPQEWGLPSLHDPYWDSLWDTVSDLELPVNFHIGSGSVGGPLSWPGFEMESGLAVSSVCLFMNNVRCLTNLIFSGLLDRYPDMKFVSVESGVGWIPVVLECCAYQLRENFSKGSKGLKLSPQEYFQRQIYAAFWFEHQDLAHTIDLVGEDKVLFETDFPHPTCLYDDIKERVEESLGGLDEKVRRKVLYENAAEVYGIGLPG